LNAVCLLVAGALSATLPDPEFTLAWDHSVQKTRWEERYRVDGERLRLVEARVEGTGAGMEPPPSAVLRDGAWTWRPGTLLPELRLTLSRYTSDYMLCSQGRCRTLGALVAPAAADATVVVRPCSGTRPIAPSPPA
jgi:hypothetical protein